MSFEAFEHEVLKLFTPSNPWFIATLPVWTVL